MPKDDTKAATETPVIDEHELDGFVSVGMPRSPHVTFNLEKNKQYDSIRNKNPKGMFYTRWEFEKLVTRSYDEHKKEQSAQAKSYGKKETTDTPLLDNSLNSSNATSETIFRGARSGSSKRPSGRATRKVVPQRRHNHLPLMHTYFGAPFGITERTQMDAYRLWAGSDSSDEDLEEEKDEGKKCCGICVMQ